MVAVWRPVPRSCIEMKNRFFRYLTVGAFNTLFGYAIIFSGMYLLEMTPEMSNALGYSLALLLSFVLNRTFTFKSTGCRTQELGRFLAVFLVAYSANFVALYVLVRVLFVNAAISQVLAGIFYVGFSYAMNKNFVFNASQKNSGTKF